MGEIQISWTPKGWDHLFKKVDQLALGEWKMGEDPSGAPNNLDCPSGLVESHSFRCRAEYVPQLLGLSIEEGFSERFELGHESHFIGSFFFSATDPMAATKPHLARMLWWAVVSLRRDIPGGVPESTVTGIAIDTHEHERKHKPIVRGARFRMVGRRREEKH